MKKRQNQKDQSLSTFYAKFYFKFASLLKWPIFLFLIFILGTSLIILVTEQLTDAKYHFYAIETISMEPTLEPGDMIITERQEGYETDDVVSFKYNDDDKKPITHRIIEIDEQEPKPITTKGDNNDQADAIKLDNSQVIGKVIKDIPNLGNIVLFTRSVEGIILLYIIPITILLTLNIQSIYKWLEDKAKS